jgi:hypothetical protein
MNNERTKVETSNEKVQTVYKDQIPRGPEAIATDKDGYVYVHHHYSIRKVLYSSH